LLQAGRYVIASPVGGIPDIYAGRPEIGELVKPGNPILIADALDRGISKVFSGSLDPANIRQVYLREFSGEVAHTQFVDALGIESDSSANAEP
jgi:glycosyltransferase involved in cell wall biosynthesis